MLVATCNRLFQIGTETRQLRLMAQLYVGTRPIPKGMGELYRGLLVFAFHVPLFWTLATICTNELHLCGNLARGCDARACSPTLSAAFRLASTIRKPEYFTEQLYAALKLFDVPSVEL
jgi:hypothetical protein